MARRLTPDQHFAAANKILADTYQEMQHADLSDKLAYALVQATLSLYVPDEPEEFAAPIGRMNIGNVAEITPRDRALLDKVRGA
ncbi:hypothetical protein CN1A_28 [Clavibacter phage CN1A]|uniref:Uncharacterized protein n=1 Tax=Clavibacter phage CN1A TaxID=1406793 RepID=U5PX26_9CAUD|nr:hypothetical protein CN1A_28 [Clavibacter phage CN1A]AGY47137.1 hypothetical protein CN1A_28 [Clavibacter phage CN1A]